MSMSGLVSELKVTMPCTSEGAIPASSSAAATASTARRSSERPESLENSVAPMPAMAVRPEKAWAIRRPLPAPRLEGQDDADGPADVVTQLVGAADGDRHDAAPPSSARGPFAVTDPVSVMVQSG